MNTILVMPTRTTVLALACVCVWPYSLIGGQLIPPPAFEDTTKGPEKNAPEAKPTFETSPFGMAHDFGKVKSGSAATHAFCILNTSKVPLRILSVRAPMGPLHARMSKRDLQPDEEAKLEIELDTRRFQGRRTIRVWVMMQSGNKRMETVVRVSAESIWESEP